jgi:MFS family permease
VLLGLLALLMLLPVTLPVPVLRGLVADRFEVSELATSAFMSINMVGAFLAAPLVGLLADRFGKRKRIVLVALGLDALLLLSLTFDLSFGVFMGLRFIEGAAHIAALSMLLSLAADRRSGAVMGLVGAGLTLGVALGAALGGWIGAEDPLQPLRVGAIVLVAALLVAARVLKESQALHARPKFAELVELLENRPRLLLPLAFAFVDRFTVGFFTTTFPLYLSGVHRASAPRIGVLLASLLIPFALLSYPFGRIADRVGRVQLVLGGSLVYGIGAAFVGRLGPDELQYLMPVLGIASAVMFVPNLLLTTDLAPLELRSTAMAGFNAAGSAGFILGPVVGGFLSTRHGYPVAFLVAGASEILCVLLLLRPLARAAR